MNVYNIGDPRKWKIPQNRDELDRSVEIYTVCLRFVNIKLLKHAAQ